MLSHYKFKAFIAMFLTFKRIFLPLYRTHVKVKAIHEHFQYENYLHCVKCRLFTGTYEEYKERIKLGAIGYSQKI